MLPLASATCGSRLWVSLHCLAMLRSCAHWSWQWAWNQMVTFSVCKVANYPGNQGVTCWLVLICWVWLGWVICHLACATCRHRLWCPLPGCWGNVLAGLGYGHGTKWLLLIVLQGLIWLGNVSKTFGKQGKLPKSPGLAGWEWLSWQTGWNLLGSVDLLCLAWLGNAASGICNMLVIESGSD